MSDNESNASVIAASDIEVDHASLDASITEFAGKNGDYYAKQFHRIHSSTGLLPNTFNLMAAVLGPVWAASRAVWGMFWGFLILEMIAWVQIGRGWWGDPGANFFERAAKQQERAEGFLERAEAARAAGEDPSRFENSEFRGDRHPAWWPLPATAVQDTAGVVRQLDLRKTVQPLADRPERDRKRRQAEEYPARHRAGGFDRAVDNIQVYRRQPARSAQ
jgi:hypothetical protein